MDSSPIALRPVIVGFVYLITAAAAYYKGPPQNPGGRSTRNVVDMKLDGDVSGLAALAKIGSKNHLPMGIVLPAKPATTICNLHLDLASNKATIADLIQALDERLPEYNVAFEENTLLIMPKRLSGPTADLLGYRLAEFHTGPGTLHAIGFSLWDQVHATFAPLQGSAFAGGAPTGKEVAPALDLRNQTVESILDRIVGLGDGGMWIMSSSETAPLGPSTALPFKVFSYSDTQGLSNRVATCQ